MLAVARFGPAVAAVLADLASTTTPAVPGVRAETRTDTQPEAVLRAERRHPRAAQARPTGWPAAEEAETAQGLVVLVVLVASVLVAVAAAVVSPVVLVEPEAVGNAQ